MSIDVFGPGIISTVGMYSQSALTLTALILRTHSLRGGTPQATKTHEPYILREESSTDNTGVVRGCQTSTSVRKSSTGLALT